MFVRIYEQQIIADLYNSMGIGFNSWSKLSVVVVSILVQLQENISHEPIVTAIILRNVGWLVFQYILDHM